MLLMAINCGAFLSSVKGRPHVIVALVYVENYHNIHKYIYKKYDYSLCFNNSYITFKIEYFK